MVLSLRPLQVKIIDFDRSVNRGLKSKGTYVGTPGYYPYRPLLEDGSTKWDIWALGAMILEADLEKDVYLNVENDRVAQNMCQKHLRSTEVNQELKDVLRMTVMADFTVEIQPLEKIMTLIPKMKFRMFKDRKGKII